MCLHSMRTDQMTKRDMTWVCDAKGWQALQRYTSICTPLQQETNERGSSYWKEFCHSYKHMQVR